MAHPYVDSHVATAKTSTATVTEFVVTLPTYSAGDMLLIVARKATTTNAGFFIPSGWTGIASDPDVFVVYKIASGGEGADVNIYSGSTGARIAATAMCIKGAGDLEFESNYTATIAAGVAAPPSLTTSWGGGVDTLYLSALGARRSYTSTDYTYAGYSVVASAASGGSSSSAHCCVYVAEKDGVGGTAAPEYWAATTDGAYCANIAIAAVGVASRRRSPLMLTPW